MDTRAWADYLKVARRLASDIDDIVARRRAALELLEREGLDTRKERRLLNISEELQRKIWSDKERLEKEFQELLKRQDDR